MQPDMWSGWGIRTLSALHPSFNPYSYQTGSVWPHDNAIIALGFRRYGFAAEAAAVARDISDAASHFLINQLPELYAGAAAGRQLPGAISRRQRAAGLGRGHAVSCCCRPCSAYSRTRRAAGLCRPCPPRLDAGRDADRPAARLQDYGPALLA